MPGIVGLITKLPREWAEPQLLAMVEAIRHETFYVTGTLTDESLGVYVGWAARKGSFCDEMPLQNERGDVSLVFSGEDFAEPGIARQLRQQGHVIPSNGASYLVHLGEDDSRFPASLNGRFHGLLIDRRAEKATLFNDRYGMHRVYYHESAEGFYFAAEAKAILAVRPELRRADPKGLGELVACGCVLDDRTFFEAIRVLPPAAAWTFRRGAHEQKSAYFEPREWEEQTLLEEEAYYRQLREVFSRRLPRYFNGHEPVGMSLTGGLDTRMIMAWHRPPQGSLPCYSFGGMFRDCQDVILARRVAQSCRQQHEVIPVADEFLAHFGHYAERTVYLTDGCIDVSHSPDLYVNERAREIAPVRMTGNYGGEVMRRVRLFKPRKPTEGLYSPDFLGHVNDANKTFANALQMHPLSFTLFRQSPWYHYGLLALEQTQLSLRSPFLDNDFVKTVYRAPSSAWTNNDICLRLISDGDAALGRIRTDLGVAYEEKPLSATATRRLLQFTFKAEYAYDYGMPQWVARIDHLFSHLRLERLFLGRHKFYHFRIWYRDALAKYVQEMLLDPRTLSRPYLEGHSLEKMVRGHLKGDQNYTTAIHKVLTLELLHRQFIDAN